MIETLAQDVRYGLRMLRRAPGFTVIAVVTLALGIGANTAIFSIVNALLFRPLPARAPQEVVSLISHDQTGSTSNGFSYPDFEDIRSQTTGVFNDLAGVQVFQMDGLSIRGQSQPMWTSYVTANFFQVLGVQATLGSVFQPIEGKLASSDPVMVLGYSFWQNRLGGDRNLIGQSVSVNGHPVTIIGVAPKGFCGIAPILDTQAYLPIGMAAITADSKPGFLADRRADSLVVFGRLSKGLRPEGAKPELDVVARRISHQYADIHKWDSLQAFTIGALGPGTDSSAPATIKKMAALFLVLVGLVLVLACMNVANLLLVRAAARQREMAIRSALGAGARRLVRQLLTESLMLAVLGCGVGILMGLSVTNAISSVNFSTGIPIVFDLSFDWRVFAYALCAALVTGALVGIGPAIRVSRGNLNNLLHESLRTSTVSRQRARSALVVAEIAGSLMLLIVAGLFVRSLQAVERADLGFDPEGVVNLSLAPTEGGYEEPEARELLENILQRTNTLPGVESASLALTVPMGYYSYGDDLRIDGYLVPNGQEPPSAGFNAVSPRFFQTMRIALIRGRSFVEADNQKSENVAVINEEMARRYWPNEDSVGRTFSLANDASRPIRIVGVVKNSRTGGLTGPFRPYFYRPFAQDYQVPVTLQLRTTLPAATSIREATEAVHSLAPAIPVFDVQTMSQALDTLNGLLLYKLGAGLTGAMGILGLLLGTVGVYGVVSYAASQRTHEIGIRMALGAQPSQVRKSILSQGMIVTGVGLLIGILLAGLIARAVGDFLAEVSPLDPLTYFVASLLIAFVALSACYIPARRAMRVDPMVALRHE